MEPKAPDVHQADIIIKLFQRDTGDQSERYLGSHPADGGNVVARVDEVPRVLLQLELPQPQVDRLRILGERETDTQVESKTGRKYRWTDDRWKGRQTDGEAKDRHADGEADTDRQIPWQTDRQIERQLDRQTVGSIYAFNEYTIQTLLFFTLHYF